VNEVQQTLKLSFSVTISSQSFTTKKKKKKKKKKTKKKKKKKTKRKSSQNSPSLIRLVPRKQETKLETFSASLLSVLCKKTVDHVDDTYI
jgi:hypothetical protein